MSTYSSSTNPESPSSSGSSADEMETQHTQSPAAVSGVGSDAEEEREPCPTPLEWHEVVRSFVRDAEHWYLDVGEDRVLGRTWGTGPALYFLNGMAGTHELYCLIVWLLREDFRCVVFDYPDSPQATTDSLSQLLPEIVRMHGDVEPVAVFARDFGSQVAKWTAEEHPGLIGSLICQTPLHGLSLNAAERVLARLGRHLPFRSSRLPGRFMIQQRSHRIWFPPYDRSRFDFYLDNSGEQSVAGVSQRFLLSGAPIGDWNAESAPQKMLIVRAEGESPAQATAADRISRSLPHAQTDWLPTSGQLASLTHPHRVAKLVREFLNGVETADRRE